MILLGKGNSIKGFRILELAANEQNTTLLAALENHGQFAICRHIFPVGTLIFVDIYRSANHSLGTLLSGGP